MRILNVVRERNSEGWSTIDSFLVEDYVVNSEEALRNAVKDYIQSEEGKQDVIDTNGDFNWGVGNSLIKSTQIYTNLIILHKFKRSKLFNLLLFYFYYFIYITF